MRLMSLAPLMALFLAGCGAIGAIGIPLGGGQTAAPMPLTIAAPTTAVEAGALPPPAEATPPDLLQPAGAPGEPNQAAVLAAATPVTVGRTDLLGGWTLISANDTCALFLTLTAWTGGYRASTRDCLLAGLIAISAWDLLGQEVVLAAADGTPFARLRSVGPNRFEGQTVSGGATIVFYR